MNMEGKAMAFFRKKKTEKKGEAPENNIEQVNETTAEESAEPANRTLAQDIPVYARWAEKNLLSTGYQVDGAIESLKEIDRFIEENNKPGGSLYGVKGHICFGLGCYLGEILIRNFGGQWKTDDDDPQGEVNIAVVFPGGGTAWPTIRVMKRVAIGAEYDIYKYAVSIRNHVMD
jgi:hypothetical protein